MSKTDWERIQQMTDEDIDFGDIPEATSEQMSRAVPLEELFPELVHTQQMIALDDDVAEWVMQISEEEDPDYEAIINRIVRAHIAKQESLEDTLRRVIREELHSVTA